MEPENQKWRFVPRDPLLVKKGMFEVRWKDGTVIRIEGPDILSALNDAGYFGGQLSNIDSWAEIKLYRMI